MAKKTQQRTLNFNNRKFETIGGETAFWSDLYHRSMTISLPLFVVVGLAMFVLNNMFFACLYMLDPAAVTNVVSPRFLNLFFFSVEAFTTVGFGDMHPADIWGHSIFSIEGYMSVIETAALTGLMFARFSRPNARILFSNNPVIGAYNGSPHLMLRLANSRQNYISDATVQLWVLRNEINKDGQNFRRFHELPLLRHQNPTFVLSWTLFHPIDSNSLLHGLKPEDFAKLNLQFILTMKGMDDTSSQELRARKTYTYDELLWNRQFVDILQVGETGTLTLDYRKFHDTRAG